MTDLPAGWCATKLENLGEWSSGGTPSRKIAAYFGRDIPWAKTGDLKHELINEVEEAITNAGLKNSAAKVFPKGTLLVAMYGATIGQTGILKFNAATNQACAALRADGTTTDVIPYVWRYIISQQGNLKAIGQGGAQPNISQTILKDFPINIAPLPEQRRIVAKIDSLTEKSKRARDHLDHVPRLVEKYKQAILAAVCRGELSRVAGTVWRSVTVDDLCQIIFDGPFGSNLTSKDYTPAGARVMRLENIGHLRFLSAKRAYISLEKFESLKRHTLQTGDILFSSFVDEKVRVCLLPPDVDTPAINKADCFCIRVDQRVCDPRFLTYRLACRSTYEILKDGVHGATRPRINLTQLRVLQFDVPDLSEQREIVRRIEAAFAWIDRIASEATSARKLIDHLDQAVLAKAFRGELVPQDPDDEPASILLERIRAERQEATKIERRRRAKAET
jgi:type I restriction enzyme S subunit